LQENIKANKQKIGALSEVKEQLAEQFLNKEKQLEQLTERNSKVSNSGKLLHIIIMMLFFCQKIRFVRSYSLILVGYCVKVSWSVRLMIVLFYIIGVITNLYILCLCFHKIYFLA